jgi:hypothetical protein
MSRTGISKINVTVKANILSGKAGYSFSREARRREARCAKHINREMIGRRSIAGWLRKV